MKNLYLIVAIVVIANSANAQKSNKVSEDEKFTGCMSAELQRNNYYTSADGWRSAIILMGHCEWEEWVIGCQSSGSGSEGNCNVKAAMLAQAGIILREAAISTSLKGTH